MDVFLDILKILLRIITIIPFVLVITLIMGKRSIGQLPVFDFLIIITLGALVGADIAEPGINHFYTIIAIFAIFLLQLFISKILINHRKIGKLLTPEPTVVIYQGQFLVGNMKKIKYTIDNVLQMLREQEVFDVKDVEIALIEANGMLSLKKKKMKDSIKVEDLLDNAKDNGWEIPLVVDGILYEQVLESKQLDKQWLVKELHKHRVEKIEDVFYIGINKNKELHISLKDDSKKPKEPLIFN